MSLPRNANPGTDQTVTRPDALIAGIADIPVMSFSAPPQRNALNFISSPAPISQPVGSSGTWRATYDSGLVSLCQNYQRVMLARLATRFSLAHVRCSSFRRYRRF
jgi:hypothetical protein